MAARPLIHSVCYVPYAARVFYGIVYLRLSLLFLLRIWSSLVSDGNVTEREIVANQTQNSVV